MGTVYFTCGEENSHFHTCRVNARERLQDSDPGGGGGGVGVRLVLVTSVLSRFTEEFGPKLEGFNGHFMVQVQKRL